MVDKKDIFIIGKVRLNPVGSKLIPCLEIVLDTSDGRTDGEIVLLKQVSNDDNPYYCRKIVNGREIYLDRGD